MTTDQPRTLPHNGTSTTASRRAILGGLAGLAGATSGCAQRVQNIVERDTERSLSLKIKTMPADTDERTVSISQTLADRLNTVGIDTRVVPMAKSQLYRDVLINHDFDVYVAQCPGHDDPDFLRPLLHSRFTEDLGWQNPFGFADLDVDELLADQRTASGNGRVEVVSNLQRAIVRRQPFTVLAFPTVTQAVRPDRYGRWERFDPDTPLTYLGLVPRNPARVPGSGGNRLRVTTTDGRVTENFNPLMVEFRTGGTFTHLVYDRLAYRYQGRTIPWLARRWTWETDSAANRQRIRIALRENGRWHDGRPVTANDVAFTYRFLADTSLGRQDVPVPAPRFHGRMSLVEAVDAVDDHTVRIELGPCNRTVAEHALEVPILPRREWEPKATEPDIAGVDMADDVTKALVWNNPDPVGSGPLRFQNSVSGEQLVLSRFDRHFLHDGPTPSVPRPLADGVPFARLDARVVPSSGVAVALLGADRADVTATHVNVDVVPRIVKHDELGLHATTSRSFYHVGFNVRHAPLSNPRFRRVVARLLDRSHLVSDTFEGYATPAISPLGGSNWIPSDLEWAGESPTLQFFGDDGTFDAEAARAAFREAGYRPMETERSPKP